MRPAQAVMADLAAAGLTPGQLALIMELSATVAAEARPVEDGAAQRRRAKDRAYQAERRLNRQISADSNDDDAAPCLDKEAPQTPEEIKPIPCVRVARAWTLPIGVSLQVWTDFLDNRKRKRLGRSETAWKAFNDDLKRVASQTGIPPPQLIEMCTAKGWGAIYDPREERHGSQSQSGLRGNRPNLTQLLRASSGDPQGGFGARPALPASGDG